MWFVDCPSIVSSVVHFDFFNDQQVTFAAVIWNKNICFLFWSYLTFACFSATSGSSSDFSVNRLPLLVVLISSLWLSSGSITLTFRLIWCKDFTLENTYVIEISHGFAVIKRFESMAVRSLHTITERPSGKRPLFFPCITYVYIFLLVGYFDFNYW